MTITTQSADGVLHQFPDGTADTVIDGAMRDYAQNAGPRVPELGATQARNPPPDIAAIQASLSPKAQASIALAKSRVAGFKGGDAATAGLSQGALDVYRSVFDQPAAWLEKNIGQLPGPSAVATNEQDKGVAANLDQQMGGKLSPQIMRLIGNAAASAPLLISPNLGASRIAQAASGAVQGGQAAALANAGQDRSLGSQVATGAAVGGAIPLVAGGLYDAAQWAGRTAFPTGDVNPEVTTLARRAQELGVPIRPGQMSGSPTMKVWDDQLSRMPGTGYTPDNPLRISPNAQHEAFSRAVSRTFGEDAPALTQDVMANAHDRITGAMNDVIARNKVQATPELSQGLLDIEAKAADALDEDAKPVSNAVRKIWNQLTNGEGEITGSQYLEWRKRGGRLAALTDNQNPTVAHYGQQIRNALDDAFAAQAPEADAAALATARSQYRNLKTVEPLAAKAPTGRISPALLLGAVRGEFPDMARNGAGDLGDLARIGQQFLKEPPNSTTAERGLLLQLLKNPLGAVATGASLPLTATVGRGIGGAINSQTYLNRLEGVPVPAVPLGGADRINPARLPPLLLAPLLNRLLAPPIHKAP